MTSRGFTLVELLIAMTLAAILATALVRILLSDSRFVSQQDAMMAARQTARAAQNVTSVELRMVSDGGLVSAAPESVTVRVPYVFGIACGVSGSERIAALMPADSLMYTSAVPDGIMRRGSGGTYVQQALSSVSSSSDLAACTSERIQVVPGGTLIALQPQGVVPTGEIFYLYQTVSYRFFASTDLPGRIGLWRRVNAGAYEELVAPFDSTARFRFLVDANPQPADVPPGNLARVTGLELNLVTQSYAIPQGKPDYTTFELPVQIAFLNVAN